MIETFQVFLTSITILLSGLVLFLWAFYSARLLMKRRVSVQAMFLEFGKKMWMTIGLGVFFCTVYLSFVFVGSYLIDDEFRIRLFNWLYNDPVVFIYGGLLIFAAISTLIYLVRMVIKHLCNSRYR